MTQLSSWSALRTDLLASLVAALGSSWDVASSAPVDEVNKRTVYLTRTQVAKASTGLGQLANEFVVYVIFPQGTPEDDIDESIETVMTALDAWSAGAWRTGERGIYSGTNPSWEFTIGAFSTRPQPQP